MNIKQIKTTEIYKIAQFIIKKDENIEPIKLQKYLYYFNIVWFLLYKNFYFKNEYFKPWKHGPICFEIWNLWSSRIKKINPQTKII